MTNKGLKFNAVLERSETFEGALFALNGGEKTWNNDGMSVDPSRPILPLLVGKAQVLSRILQIPEAENDRTRGVGQEVSFWVSWQWAVPYLVLKGDVRYSMLGNLARYK
jgi:hypothetical protein